MNILVINGHDYTRWVQDDGYDWSRDDLDSEKTVRVKTGNMRRDKITEKRNLTYTMLPMAMTKAVEVFAGIMGVEIDPRTTINPAYTIDYPASDPDSETGDYYSIRQELQWIAAAHAGNWIVTGEGKLLLVPLLSIPKETNYLVTEYGDAITLGGVRILV